MSPQKLKKIADEFRPIFAEARSVDGLSRKMRGLGFKTSKSTGIAYIGENFVIKIGYFPQMKFAKYNPRAVFDKKYKIPSRIEECPCKYLKYGDSYLKEWYKFVIQPKADRYCAKNSEMIKEFIEACEEEIDYRYDIHKWNCGIYEGRIVLFDW